MNLMYLYGNDVSQFLNMSELEKLQQLKLFAYNKPTVS